MFLVIQVAEPNSEFGSQSIALPNHHFPLYSASLNEKLGNTDFIIADEHSAKYYDEEGNDHVESSLPDAL